MLTLYHWWLDHQIHLSERILEMWDGVLNKDKDWQDTRIQLYLILAHLRKMRETTS